MKKFLLLLFLPFLLGASAQDTGWLTRSNCLSLGNPQQFGTVCLNTASGTLSQGHQYTYQGGSPGSAGSWLDTTGGGTGGGSVNIFSSGNLSPLFTTSVATPTTTPAQSFTLSNVAANTIFGNATSGSTTPSFGQLVTGQITNSAVTLAKIQNAASSSKLLGSGATGSGTPYTEITLGTGLSMSGTTLNTTGGGGGITQLTGDVTAGPGSGVLAATIANSAVSLAKIANATANSVLLGSGTAGSGAPYTQILLGSGLTMTGTTLSVLGSMTGVGTTGTIPVFTGASALGNSIMTQPDVNTIAIGSGNTGLFQMGSLQINGVTSGTITIQPQAAAGTYNFNLPTTAGTSGQCLISGGGGAAANTWGTCGSGGGGSFATLTGGTNTVPAAMLVGNGSTLGYTGTGTIDATTVNGSVVAPVRTAQTTDPTSANNTAGGYPDGSEWLNTTAAPPRTWLKISESSGTAVWRNISGARSCEITWGSKSSGASAIATDDDVSTVCVNQTGATQTVLSVQCTASNTITFDVTAGNGGSSILTGAVTCGTAGTFNTATLSGTPTIADGATLDVNVNTNAGSATYAVVRIKKL